MVNYRLFFKNSIRPHRQWCRGFGRFHVVFSGTVLDGRQIAIMYSEKPSSTWTLNDEV